MGSGETRSERVPEKGHFTGHRRGARRLCVMPVEMTGTSGVFQGRTIDLSRSGALIEIRDPLFPSGSGSILEFAKRVAAEFPRQFPVRFADLPLVVELRVARVTRHPAAASLLIGCSFVNPLNDRQCRVLGVPTDRKGDSRLT
jgi:PilZ domain